MTSYMESYKHCVLPNNVKQRLLFKILCVSNFHRTRKVACNTYK